MNHTDQEAFAFVVDGYRKVFPCLNEFTNQLPPAEFDQDFCDRNGVEGRCTKSFIYLEPNCPHLTIAHEVAHFVLYNMVQNEYSILGQAFSEDKIYSHSLSGLKLSSRIISLLYDLDQLTANSPEVTNAKSSPIATEDPMRLSAFTRTDEALANSFAQYVVFHICPAELDFLDSAATNSLETDGYWKENTFRQISQLLNQVCHNET